MSTGEFDELSRYPTEYPRSLEAYASSARGRVGGLSSARKRLSKQLQTPEVKAKIADIDRRLGQTRSVIEVVSPKPPAPIKMKIWEYTRYYKYGIDGHLGSKKSAKRHLECRVYLPFPAGYSESDVREHTSEADTVVQEAIIEAFRQTKYSADIWDAIMADISWDSLPSSGGWEQQETENMSDTDRPVVNGTVDDQLDHYWKGVKDVRVSGMWRIPDWRKP